MCYLRDEESPIFELEFVNSDHISNYTYQGEYFGIEVRKSDSINHRPEEISGYIFSWFQNQCNLTLCVFSKFTSDDTPVSHLLNCMTTRIVSHLRLSA